MEKDMENILDKVTPETRENVIACRKYLNELAADLRSIGLSNEFIGDLHPVEGAEIMDRAKYESTAMVYRSC